MLITTTFVVFDVRGELTDGSRGWMVGFSYLYVWSDVYNVTAAICVRVLELA